MLGMDGPAWPGPRARVPRITHDLPKLHEVGPNITPVCREGERGSERLNNLQDVTEPAGWPTGLESSRVCTRPGAPKVTQGPAEKEFEMESFLTLSPQ